MYTKLDRMKALYDLKTIPYSLIEPQAGELYISFGDGACNQCLRNGRVQENHSCVVPSYSDIIWKAHEEGVLYLGWNVKESKACFMLKQEYEAEFMKE